MTVKKDLYTTAGASAMFHRRDVAMHVRDKLRNRSHDHVAYRKKTEAYISGAHGVAVKVALKATTEVGRT